MSVESYLQQIDELKEELAEKEQDVLKAAQIGKCLLDTNTELEERLEAQQKEHQVKVEEALQECYCLQKKLDHKTFMEKNYLDDIENYKNELKKHKSNQETAVELELQSKLMEMKKQNGHLQQELEKVHLSDRQSKEKIESLTEDLEGARYQLSVQETRFNESCSEELARLLSDVSNLQMEKAEVTNELRESQATLEKNHMSFRHLESSLAMCQQEIEEKECQIGSYQNSIEKFKFEMLDLQAQLDAARSEHFDRNKKGNSLFAEVDDRRCNAEKELKVLKARHESEKKNNEILKQQLHRLKMQIPGLLNSGVGKADGAYVERLEKRISHVKSENEMLRTKCAKAELDLEKVESKIREEFSKFNSDKSNQEYSEYMQSQVEVKSQEITRLKQELQRKTLHVHAESDTRSQAERKVYRLQGELGDARGEITKLALKIEELKLKYDPDSVKMGRKIERRHYEKIPMPKETEIKITEDHKRVKGLNASKANSTVLNTTCKPADCKGKDTEKENKSKPKSVGRKTVSISDDVAVNEVSYYDEVPLQEQNSSVGEGEDDGAAPKGKVRGKVRHHKVVHVSSKNTENEQCKQQ